MEFNDWQFKTIEELVEAEGNEKIKLFPFIEYVSTERGDELIELEDYPLKMTNKEIRLLNKIRYEKVKLKFGDLKQIKIINKLRLRYLGEKYCEFLSAKP